MSHQVTCVLCATTGSTSLISDKIRDDDSDKFCVVTCDACGHMQLSPSPTEAEDQAFYDKDGQTKNLLGTPDYDLWQKKSVADTTRRVEWLTEVLGTTGKTVLDIGCGYGFFVEAATAAGHAITGIEPSTDRIELAQKNGRGHYIHGDVNDQFCHDHAQSYDALTLFHVLEHMRAPAAFLQECARLLKPGGHFLIEIPNAADEVLDQCPAYRSFYWQRAHISYFDPMHFQRVLDDAGFTKTTIVGIQRYGLMNLLHWLEHGSPQLNDPSFQASKPILEHLESLYRTDREQRQTCDTLIADVTIV